MVLSATLGAIALSIAAAAQEPSEDLASLEARAEQRYAEDDLVGAITMYKQLGRLHPAAGERARVLIAAAWLEHTTGKWEAAEESMYRALTFDPDYPFEAEFYSQDFVTIHQRSLQRVLSEREELATARVNDALEAMAEADYASSRGLLEEALRLDPDAPAALYNLALVELREGRSEPAIAGFQRLLSLADMPGDRAEVSDQLRAQALNNLGLLYYQKGFYDDAVQVLERSLELDPDNGRAWTNLGLSHRRLGQRQTAVEALSRARELAPGDPAVMSNLALAHLDARQWDRAAELLEAGVSEHPENPSLWLNLGLAQRGMRELEQASESFRRVVGLDRGNSHGFAATASTHLALVRFEARDYAGAVAAARRALDWVPESADSWVYLGLAQHSTGDYAAAQQSLQRALAIDPTRAETANNLGNAYFAAGDYEAARGAFEQALALRPEFSTAEQNLALTLERLERAEVAQAASPPPPPPPTKSTTRAAKPAKPPPTKPTRATSTRRPKRGKETPGAPVARSNLGVVFIDDRHPASGGKAARVESVGESGSGVRAGLEQGDLVVRADNAAVESATRLRQLLLSLPVGRQIPLDLVRGEETLRLTFRAD